MIIDNAVKAITIVGGALYDIFTVLADILQIFVFVIENLNYI